PSGQPDRQRRSAAVHALLGVADAGACPGRARHKAGASRGRLGDAGPTPADAEERPRAESEPRSRGDRASGDRLLLLPDRVDIPPVPLARLLSLSRSDAALSLPAKGAPGFDLATGSAAMGAEIAPAPGAAWTSHNGISRCHDRDHASGSCCRTRLMHHDEHLYRSLAANQG